MARAPTCRACLALALVAGVAAAEPGPWTIRHWDESHGLPQASVTALAQDHEGFLWVGTFGGLARFDGRAFRQVPLDGPVAVDTFEVRCLLAEGEGLWVGTDRGLYRLRGDRLAPLPLPPPLTDRPIAALFRATDGRLWIGGDHDGLAHWAGDHFVHEPATGGGRALGLIRLGEDAAGRLLVWSNVLGLLRLQDHRLLTLRGDEASRARAWFLPRPGPRDPAPSAPWLARLPTAPNVAREPRFVAAVALDDGLFVGTADGLHQAVRNEVIPIPLGGRRTAVRALYRDRDGSLWAGTDGDGLYRLGPRWFSAITVAEGLPGPSVHGLAGDAGGTVHVALGGHGLARLDEAGRVTRVWSAEALGGHAWTALPALDGGLLVGHFVGPWTRLDGDGAVGHDGPRLGSAPALFRDRRGEVWLGTREEGAFRFNEERGEISAIRGLPGRNVVAFAEDAGGAIWIATERGAAIYADGVVHQLDSRRLPAVPIRAFLADGERMWVGTFGAGLGVEVGGRFVLLDRRRGLVENVVSWIQSAGDWIWWTGNRGVYRALRRDLLRAAGDPSFAVYPQRFTRGDGMPADETNGGAWPAGWKDRRGRFWIPTIAGLTIVDPAALDRPREPPRARIDEVVVDGRAVAAGGLITLAAEARRLEIAVSAAALSFPDHLVLATRLDGVDTDWRIAGRDGRVAYSHLRPGSYTFRVRAEDGARLGPEARLRLVQRPAFTESWPFFALLACYALGLGGALLALRAALLRRRARRAYAETARREAARREEERRYQQRLALLQRDLHDGIGGLIANIGLLAALGERATAPAGVLAGIGRLAEEGGQELRSLMNAIESRQMHWSDLLAEVRRLGHVLLAGHAIELTVEQEGEPDDPDLDTPLALTLLRLVKEALNNVVKHAGAKTVTVRLVFLPRGLRLSIRDDGRGLPVGPTPGRGLGNLRRRTSEIGGTLEFHPGPGGGLTLDLPIPLHCPTGGE